MMREVMSCLPEVIVGRHCWLLVNQPRPLPAVARRPSLATSLKSLAGPGSNGINATSARTLLSIFCLDDWSDLATLPAGIKAERRPDESESLRRRGRKKHGVLT